VTLEVVDIFKFPWSVCEYRGEPEIAVVYPRRGNGDCCDKQLRYGSVTSRQSPSDRCISYQLTIDRVAMFTGARPNPTSTGDVVKMTGTVVHEVHCANRSP